MVATLLEAWQVGLLVIQRRTGIGCSSSQQGRGVAAGCATRRACDCAPKLDDCGGDLGQAIGIKRGGVLGSLQAGRGGMQA